MLTGPLIDSTKTKLPIRRVTDMTKVLILGAPAESLRLLSGELNGCRYRVLSASTIDDGLAVAESEQPDVILLDASNEAIDYLQACRRLKQEASTRTIPVIVLAGAGQDERAVAALEAGAHDDVTGPYKEEPLAARIRAALRVKEDIEAVQTGYDYSLLLHEQYPARAKAEQQLRQSETIFRTIASAAQDGIIMLDADGNVSFWNRAAERIFGYSSDEAFGKNVHELLCRPEDLAAHRAAFPEFQRTGRGAAVGKVVQLVGIRKDGSEVPVELSLAAVRLDGSWRAVAVVRDMTQRRKAEAALRKAHDEIELIFNAAAPMVVIGSDHTIWRVNDGAAELLGMPKERIVGQLCYQLMPGSTCGTGHCCLELVKERECVELEVQKSFGGKTLQLLLRLRAYHDSEGRLIGCVQSLTDITELKRAEQALRRSELKFRTLFESSCDAIMTLTPDGRFLSANPATLRLFRCRNERHFASFGLADLSPERQPDGTPSAEKAAQMIARALRNGSHFFQWKQKRCDGTEFDATVLLTRMELDAQVLLQATVRDITEQKRREAELARLNKELVQASRRAGMAQVASCVLHNVGNVLNSVNVAVETIQQRLRSTRFSGVSAVAGLLEEHRNHLPEFFAADPRGQKVPDYLRTLGQHLEAASAETLRDLAQLRADIEHINQIVAMQQSYGQTGGIEEPVRLTELLEHALKLNNASFLRHSVEVVREYEELPTLLLDKHRLLQILVNLISNAKDALKATDRPDRRLLLRVGHGPNGYAKVEIEDNGVGIERQNLTRIFEFGFTTKKTGHGFGLHIGALIAKELGGTLTAHSDGPGTGARFTLCVPLNVAEEQPDQLAAYTA